MANLDAMNRAYQNNRQSGVRNAQSRGRATEERLNELSRRNPGRLGGNANQGRYRVTPRGSTEEVSRNPRRSRSRSRGRKRRR